MPAVWAGVDSGKRTHHCVVINQIGMVLLSRRVNNDEAEHTIVTEGAFASDPLKTRLVKAADHFSVTYVSPGTFPYFCSIHPAMKGVIEVTQ